MPVQNRVIKSFNNRMDYIFGNGKFSYKANEVKDGIISPHNLPLEEYRQRFNSLKERNGNKSTRFGRELIIPIPWELDNRDKQWNFVAEYMNNLGNRLNMNLFYLGAIHNIKKNDVPNYHAHILVSERELLDKPITKNIKTRYYDKNNKLCRKDSPEMDHCIKAHKETSYFGKANRVFNSKDFNKIIDNVRVQTILNSKDLTDKAKYTLTCPSNEKEKQFHIKKFYSNNEINHLRQYYNDSNITKESWKNEIKFINKDRSKIKADRIHENMILNSASFHLKEIKDLETIKAELREKLPDAKEETIEKLALQQLEQMNNRVLEKEIEGR